MKQIKILVIKMGPSRTRRQYQNHHVKEEESAIILPYCRDQIASQKRRINPIIFLAVFWDSHINGSLCKSVTAASSIKII